MSSVATTGAAETEATRKIYIPCMAGWQVQRGRVRGGQPAKEVAAEGVRAFSRLPKRRRFMWKESRRCTSQ